MTLMTEIKRLQVEARKKGDPHASLLTTLLGEAATVGKNDGNRETSDAEVVAVVKKFIKNIDETVKALSDRGMSTAVSVQEREILQQFLPQQLTESELIHIASKDAVNMPSFMKFLKENFAGLYDGRMAAAVAKQVYP